MPTKFHYDQTIGGKLKKEDIVTIFLLHLHLDVVPVVLLMVGMNFLAYESPVLLSYKEKKIFDDNVLCRASPGCCSRGSPGGWREKSLLQNLYIIKNGRCPPNFTMIRQ